MVRTVGRSNTVIDQFDDSVMNCHDLLGDSWQICHDTGKIAIITECMLSKLPVECDVYGLFADLIPAEATAEGQDLQWGRGRQGLVPDIRARLPTDNGPSDTLAELKFVNAGFTEFPRGVDGRGTDRRAATLSALYRGKIEKLDYKYHGV